jgi:hypothetical protein
MIVYGRDSVQCAPVLQCKSYRSIIRVPLVPVAAVNRSIDYRILMPKASYPYCDSRARLNNG